MSDDKSFFQKNWGWFALVLFVGVLIWILVRKNQPINDLSGDKKKIDSLQALLILSNDQRRSDSIAYQFLFSSADRKIDSFSSVAKTLSISKDALKKENKSLKEEVAIYANSGNVDTICAKFLSVALDQVDSLSSIADSYGQITDAMIMAHKIELDSLQARVFKSDSLASWAIVTGVLATKKYDTLYQQNKKTIGQLKTARIEVKIGAGLLLVATGWILSTFIHIK